MIILLSTDARAALTKHPIRSADYVIIMVHFYAQEYKNNKVLYSNGTFLYFLPLALLSTLDPGFLCTVRILPPNRKS